MNNINNKKVKFIKGGFNNNLKYILYQIKTFIENTISYINTYLNNLIISLNVSNDFIIYCGNPPLKENGIYDYLLQISIYNILYIIPYVIFIISLILVILFIDSSVRNLYKYNPVIEEVDGVYQNLDIIKIFNIIYVNKFIFIYLILLIIFYISCIICLIFKKYLNISQSFTKLIINTTFIISVSILLLWYIIVYNYNIKTAYSKNEKIKEKLSEYISVDYLNYKDINGNGICDFIENKKNDINFRPSNCNNISMNFSDIILKSYINEKLKLLNGKISINDVNIDMKLLESKIDDETGKSYYHLILSSIITHSLINYYIDNGNKLTTEEYFSISNILNKNKKSPLLIMNQRKNNLLVYEYNINIDDEFSNSEALQLIISKYKEIQLEISENISNFKYYSNKTLSPSYIHIIILIIYIILLVINRYL